MHPSRPAVRALVLAASVAILVAACGAGPLSDPVRRVAGAGPRSRPGDRPIESPAPSAGADPADRRPGLHPERPVRAVLPRRPGGVLPRRRPHGGPPERPDADLVTLLGQGAFDIGNSDGTSVIPAVSQGIPIVYVATIYGQFPSIVLAKADSGIKTAADLKGKKIGTPGKYGSSWIMLQALLGSANLTTDDVTIVEYPDYGQATALQQGAVDAATGFANNEPIQLRKAGIEPVVLTVDDIVPLPGPGLVTGTKTLAGKHDALGGVHAGDAPGDGRDRRRPAEGPRRDLRRRPRPGQGPRRSSARSSTPRSRRGRTRAPTRRTGRSTRAGWQKSLDFMTTLGLVPNAVTVDQLVNDSLLP